MRKDTSDIDNCDNRATLQEQIDEAREKINTLNQNLNMTDTIVDQIKLTQAGVIYW